MVSRLIISEKPQVAQKIAQALSEGRAVKKLFHSVAYFEFLSGKDKVFVSPAVGHIYSLRQKKKVAGYPVFDIEWAPSYESGGEADYTKKYLDAIATLAKGVDEVINACDYDIEGSLIGGNIIRFACNGKKPFRMHFSTLTQEDLKEAYGHLEPLDTPQIDAGEARHMLDWFWGINSSRALMQAIRVGGTFRIMSIGRVQGPALAVLAQREKEISAFVPTDYWEISAKIKEVEFGHEKERFVEEKEAQAVFQDAKSAKDALIEKVEREKFSTPAPFPFDLTTLQVEAHSAFGFEPSRTLALAQKLYEAAVISYPRTSSQKLPAKLGMEKIISALQKNPAYSRFAKILLESKRFTANEGKKEDAAHPAIHPTGQFSESIGVEERKLYDLIARRFLATFAKDALREKSKVSARLSGQGFKAQGIATIDEGWFEFYKPYLKLEDKTLPEFKEKAKEKVQGISIEKKQTQPPKRYTAASLIKKLESENLGTKATRAEIIETLKKRGYMDGKSFAVTPLGMAVFEALDKNVSEITSAELTRSFEEEMDEIQEGKIKKEKVIKEGKEALEKILLKFKQKEADIGKSLAGALHETRRAQSELGACNLCKTDGRENGTLVVKKSKFGQLIGCSNYPDCKVVFSLPKFALVQPEGSACEICGTPKVRLISKGRRPQVICPNPKCSSKENSAQEENDYSQKEEQLDFGDCIVCKQSGRTGRLSVKKSIYGRFLGCSSYPACRALYSLPKDATAIPLNEACPKCGAPKIKLLQADGASTSRCANLKCETNASLPNAKIQISLGPCKACKDAGNRGGVLVVKKSRFGQLAGCSKYPECKALYSLPRDAAVTPNATQCEICGEPVIKLAENNETKTRCVNPKCESNANAGSSAKKREKQEEKQEPEIKTKAIQQKGGIEENNATDGAAKKPAKKPRKTAK